MKTALQRLFSLLWMLLVSASLLTLTAYAENDVMGEVRFEGRTLVEKTSGVWIDGQYVGYLKELKGSKKVLLLPGEHDVVVRQGGYRDFAEQIVLQPGQTEVVRVAMEKDPREPLPRETATVKIVVNPARAAVFVDGLFIGHVREFEGIGRALLVAPGTHQIRLALPGYQTFETNINPLVNQKVELKTDLVKNGAPLEEPLIKKGTQEAASASREAPGH